jgi:hypothetical protein
MRNCFLPSVLAFTSQAKPERVLVWRSGDILRQVRLLPIFVGFALQAANLQSADLVDLVVQLS